MSSATIKLFLPRGDAKSLRTAEISNWTGKAVAAPRTELDELLNGLLAWKTQDGRTLRDLDAQA